MSGGAVAGSEDTSGRRFEADGPPGLLVLLLLLLLAGWVAGTAADRLVDGPGLERVLAHLVVPGAPAGPRLHIRSADFRPLSLSLDAEGELAARRLPGRAIRLRIEGLRIWSLALREPRADRLILTVPYVALGEGTRTAGPDSAGSGSAAGLPDVMPALRRAETALIARLPPTRLGAVELRAGTVLLADTASPVGSVQAAGVRLVLRDVRIDSTALTDGHRLLLGRSLQLRAAHVGRVASDGRSTLVLSGVSGGSRDSVLTIRSLRRTPIEPGAVHPGPARYRQDRIELEASGLTASGLDFRAFLREDALRVRRIDVAAFRASDFHDLTLPSAPRGAPPWRPARLLRSLAATVAVDTLELGEGEVRYAELPEGGTHPGTVRFDSLHAELTGLRSPGAGGPDTLLVRVHTLVQGTGRLRVRFRIPMDSSRLALRYRGGLGPVDAAVFNPALERLAGLRVKSGRLDSLWFSARLDGASASGHVGGIYRDLHLEKVDRKDLGRGIDEWISTVILETAVRNDNVPGDGPLATGRIDYSYGPNDPFFGVLWKSLRSGLESFIEH